ncbi:MAG TPA: NADH-quinone oxidoreductase subunit A [Feifaniaceae bacterium]|nr:NADH-quinone oxidoreductase subunit A [Feifaniaceae bacterium]
MQDILLSPPVVFLIFIGLSAGLSALFGRIAARGRDSKKKLDPYSCGETVPENQGQPEYSQFFHFAFFFTIMHVTVLMIATDVKNISVAAILFLALTALSLLMLFRREKDDR